MKREKADYSDVDYFQEKPTLKMELNDSGFVDDLEFVGVGEDLNDKVNDDILNDVLDTSEDVMELDEESFKHLQAKLQDIIEDGDISADDLFFKTKPCQVGLHKIPVDYGEEIKRGRKRSVINNSGNKFNDSLRRSSRISTKRSKSDSKNKSIPQTKPRKLENNSRKPREEQVREKKKVIPKVEKKTIMIIDLEEDEEEEIIVKKPEPKPRSGTGVTVKLSKTEVKIQDISKPAEVSEYERIREENIKERMEMFRSLGLNTEIRLMRQSSAPTKRNPKRKTEILNIERRKSARLSGKNDEDDDYVPDYNDCNDEPDDNSGPHGGPRKHPCKECANCLKPDCRRCVYCRDKKKYGGKNIKKQRCEFKEKCSNPIILCQICKVGGNSSECCGVSRTSEIPQSEELKDKVGNIEEVVLRRSSRLSSRQSLEYQEDGNSGLDSEE